MKPIWKEFSHKNLCACSALSNTMAAYHACNYGKINVHTHVITMNSVKRNHIGNTNMQKKLGHTFIDIFMMLRVSRWLVYSIQTSNVSNFDDKHLRRRVLLWTPKPDTMYIMLRYKRDRKPPLSGCKNVYGFSHEIIKTIEFIRYDE